MFTTGLPAVATPQTAFERDVLRGYPSSEVIIVGLVLLLLLAALVFGGVGLFAEGLKWLLIVALVLVVASAFGYRGHSHRT